MISKIAKNELIKTLHQKQFYVLLVFIVVMSLLSAYFYSDIRSEIINEQVEIGRYTQEVSESFINMNANVFTEKFMTDFIYKPMIPFFAIFMILFSIKTFSDDNISGSLKFFLLDTDKDIDVYYGKALYLFIFTTMVVIINILVGFIMGTLFFGIRDISFESLLFTVLVYVMSIIPVLSLCILIGTFSLISSKSSTFVIIGVMTSIILSFIDKFTITKHFSPIGIISKVADVSLENISFIELLKSNVISLIYIIIAMMLGNLLFKKKDWIY